MKKSLFNSTLLLVTTIIILLLTTIIMGWYTFSDKVDKSIDASTEKVVIAKSLNLGESETNSYTINNLAFFDLDSDKTFESNYLDQMAFLIQIDVTNKSTREVTVKCDFSYTELTETITLKETTDTTLDSSKHYYQYDSTNKTASLYEGSYIKGLYEESKDGSVTATLSNSYVDAVVLDKEIGTVIDQTKGTKLSLKDKYSLSTRHSGSFNLGITASDITKSFYIYIYGIQKITTSNDDFLSKNHDFKITLSAE